MTVCKSSYRSISIGSLCADYLVSNLKLNNNKISGVP